MNNFTNPFQKLLLPLLLLSGVSNLQGQDLQVTGANTAPFTPENLISNIFLGDGVEVTNITYNGAPIAVGYFTGGQSSIGIERGIVMTTGRVETQGIILGANETGQDFASSNNLSTAFDSDLQTQTTNPLFNVAVYSITFIPTSDTLRFNYSWASEEYPEYGCTGFNDVFGFFISGPNPSGGTYNNYNIARVPGTNLPVTINNVHPANPSQPGCTPFNAQYYNDNNGSGNQPTYDGFTDVFVAEAVVTPCQEYTIKLAIADAGDPVFDSGVFLEAKSFGTGSLKVEVATVSADGVVTEGCSQGIITFRLPSPTEADFPIDYNVWGTAANGIDYQTIPTGLNIPTGETELVIPIIAFEDSQAEGPEFIAIDVQRDPCTRDTVYIYLRDNQLIAPTLRADTTICTGSPALDLDGTLPIQLPDPPSFTNSQDFPIAPINTAVNSSVNVFGVQPVTLGPGVIRSVCMNITHKWDDDLYIYLLSPGGQFLELSTHNGANGDDYINTCFTPDAAQIISFPGPFAPASAAPFTGTYLPEGPWSDLWDGVYPTNGQWTLQITDKAMGFAGTLIDWTITFEPSYKVEYQWTPGAGLSCADCPVTAATPLQTTTYTVVATDSYGCSVTDSVMVEVREALPAPVITCSGQTATSISFVWTAVSGAASYEVSVNGGGWVPATGPLSHDVSGLAPNSSVTIEVRAISATLDCEALVGTATCINCEVPQVTSTVEPVSCFGEADGAATLMPDNLNPPYTFDLGSQNNSTGQFLDLPAGNYVVTVTDNSGCSTELPIDIATPEALDLTVTVQENIDCFGGANGTISTTLGGGTLPYNYFWNDPAGQITPVASNLVAGSYTVTVTDANGCSSTATAMLTEPDALTLSTAPTDPGCFGQPSGSIQATGDGGTLPYQFNWNTGPTTPELTGLPAGAYTVTITDANGCTQTESATLIEPTELTAQMNSGATTCFGGADGEATVVVTGGSLPYTFLWNDPAAQNTATASGLESGSFTVTVTDANGCSLTANSNIASPPFLSVAATATGAACNGSADGTALVSAVGGTGAHSYAWSDPAGQTTQAAGALTAGTYTVTVTDENGCSGTASATVTQPEALVLTADVQDASCSGGSDGSITVSPQGGTGPYTFTWSNGEITQGITGVGAGTYSVTVVDNQNCEAALEEEIIQADAITTALSVENVKCFGEPTGAIQLDLGGGMPPFSVSWSGPNNFTGAGVTLSAIAAGSYTGTITDAAGCIVFATAEVEQPAAALIVDLPAVADTVCFGGTDGTAAALASGGTAPYSYLWNANSQTGSTATNLSSSLYNLVVNDANGCVVSAATFIASKGEAFAYAQPTGPRCHDGTDGSAEITGVFYGADPAAINSFTFVWNTSPPQAGPQVTGLIGGQTYTVTATDAQGCSAVHNVQIANPPAVEARIDSSAQALCHGEATGWAAASGAGGSGPYTFLWGPGAASGQTDSVVRNVPAGQYRVTVTDAEGCPAVQSVVIGEPTALELELLPTHVLCFGESTGSARAQASGGVGPYQFLWADGTQGQEISGRPTGVLTLSIQDKNGCTLTDSVEIRQPAAPLTGVATVQNVRCFGGRDGRITIQGGGGTPPYRYALDEEPWNGSSVQIGLQAGQYLPRLIDKNGCILDLDPVEVEQNSRLEVDLGPDITIELGRDTQLLAEVLNASGAVQFAWNAADSVWLSCLDCLDPAVVGLQFPQEFEVRATDSLGCTALDEIRVIIDKPRRIFVPTGFSPNGDFSNDLLLVHGQTSARVLSFQVFDRWGELVYEARDFAVNDGVTGWDGQFRGKDMDPGAYVWVLEVQYVDGVKDVFKGNTTLVR